MGRKTASYLLESSEEEKRLVSSKKAHEEYQLSRRINKMSAIELYNLIVNTNIRAPYLLLHESNNKKSWEIIYNEIKHKENNTKKKEYIDTYKFVLKTILEKSDNFVDNIDNVKSLSTIAFYYLFALKNIEDWEPKRNNPHLQLESVLEHLFAKYKVPKFLYKGFYHSTNGNQTQGNDHKMIELFLHIGSGGSLKKFTNAPKLKLNNKVYHHLFTTPEHLGYYQAFRRAQIFSMGGDRWLFETFMDSKLQSEDTIKNDEFWVTVIQFFITNVMVSETKIKEIIDYIEDQKFQRRFVNGAWENPPLPNFQMKGRTVDSLIRLSDNWHHIQEEAAKAARLAARNQDRVMGQRRSHYVAPKDFSWDRSSIKGYYHIDNKSKVAHDIIELVNSRQLRDQSESQRNCVYSYASSCAEGRCHIFTLRDTINGPILTIEVRGYKLVQIRGKCNRMPTESEMRHVRAWAEKERLTIA